MKPLLVIFYASLFCTNCIWSQSEITPREFSFSLQNGISNHVYFGDTNEEPEMAYVNAFRFQVVIGEPKKYRSILGVQYGKAGTTTNWVCSEIWDYCEMFGLRPITVKSVERQHFLSFFYNAGYSFFENYYVQGGLSTDIPFLLSYRSKFTSGDDQKTREKDITVYGRKILPNITFGANLVLGKKFSINEKWNYFVEIEYKMYNLIAIRFENYEEYIFRKEQKPWVFGLNLGVSFQ